MKLLDADVLLLQMKNRRNYIGRASDPVCLVEDAPPIEAEPIRYSAFYTDDDPDEWYGRSNSCASCKSVWLGPTQYCPNCGAKLKRVVLQITNDEYNRYD